MNGNVGVPWEVVCSVLLTVLLSVLRIKDGWQNCSACVEITRLAANYRPQDTSQQPTLKWYIVLCSLIGVIGFFTLVVVYAVLKLVAMFVCSDSMWNLTGCVPFS